VILSLSLWILNCTLLYQYSKCK